MSENSDSLNTTSPSVVRQHVATIDGDISHLSPTTITTTLAECCELLKESRLCSSPVPFRKITQFVSQAVSEQSLLSTVLQATSLYIDLLAYVSMAYDDIVFSTCMHRISKIPKDAATANCLKHKSKKLMLCCSSDDHLSPREYISFWSHVVDQLDSSQFHTKNDFIASHLVRALGNILRYAQVPDLLQPVVSVVSQLFSSRYQLSNTISAVYRMAFPALMNNTPSSNRVALVKVLVCAAEAESEVTTNDHRPMSEDDENPDEGADKNSSNNSKDEITSQISTHDHSPRSSKSVQSRGSPRALINFFKFCILRVPDKAEIRTVMASTMMKVLNSLGETSRQEFSNVLRKCVVHARVPTRLASTDLASQLALDGDIPQLRDALISLLAVRCNDRVASVRSKAISYLLNVTTDLMNSDSPCITSQAVDNYVVKIRDRLQDEKSTVRKAAVDFVGFACTFLLRHQLEAEGQELNNSPDYLATMLTYRCADVVASVRLAAANQIFQIIHENCNSRISGKTLMVCIESVLPLVDDVDNRCREACLQFVHSVMFKDHLQRCSGSFSEITQEDAQVDARRIFSRLLASQKQIEVRLAERAISAIVKEGKLNNRDIETFCKPITDRPVEEDDDSRRERQGLWVAVASLALGGKGTLLWDIFGTNMMMREMRGHNGSACKVAYAHVENMNEGEKKRLESELVELMFHKDDDIDWIDGSGIQAISQVLGRLQGDTSGDKFLIRCENMTPKSVEDMSCSEVIHLLHLIGNICDHMKIEKTPPEKLLKFVQVMTSNEQNESRIRALALVTLGKICLCETTPSATKSNGQTITSLTNIGETLTRRFVSVFVHELDNAVSSATRANAVVILCDLCRQYTAIVEPFMTRIAGLLSDKSVFVRNQVLCSLMCLLQEDYIKIRPGFLLFQIIKRLLDESEDVCATAEYSLIHLVTQKKKSVLAVCFVDVIMILNECTQSETVTQFESALQSDLITTGKENISKRNKIYNVLLSGMTAEQRWQIPSRLRKDIICNIVDEKMSLDDKGVASVLEDTLNILSWDTINFLNKRRVGESAAAYESGTTTATEIIEGGDNDAGKVNDITRFAHILALREHTMPLLIELRQLLQSKRSPILGTLDKCICRLLQPQKEQLHLFITDATIRSQIEHEMNQ